MSAHTGSQSAITSEQLDRTKRAAQASFLGSMLEYYDFVIYASAAALVFNKIFFPETSAATGLLLALATFGVAYVARPVGAVVLGHYGDKIGRKKVMMFTIILMGTATFLIGCLPSYNTIGWVAPALLVLMRIAQGFSAGGEQSGANALIMEHAPTKHRNYYASWTMTGTTAGIVVASIAFLPVAALPDEALLSWGWRVPFWLSAVVVLVAYIVRRKLEEPEVFEEAKEHKELAKFPIIDMFRTHPIALVRVIACSMTAAVGSIFNVFGLAYATNTVGLDRSVMLWVVIVSNFVALAALPLFSALSDRIGRKPVYLAGVVGCAVFTFAYFAAISTGNWILIFLGAIALTSLSYSAIIGIGTAFYPEMFHTRIRYTGSAIGTQIGYAAAGFAPTIGYAILGQGTDGWIPIAIMAAVICVIAFVAAATARETNTLDIHELGNFHGQSDTNTAARKASV
ncbi:MHS family MFS transporter [Arthrobacter sp. BHU FT2]|nr:MHS family MFS transporter [Arthrobacter sp. BHU FT2]